MKIKNKQIKFTVTVEVACTEPESFKSQKEFDTQDGKHMRGYIKEKLEDAMRGTWANAARVERFNVKIAPSGKKGRINLQPVR